MKATSADAPSTQPYKYNGKEFVEMYGYDTYDYGARGYYPAIMRFTTMDPLSEKYYHISPYAYCANNPIKFIDIGGDSIFPINPDVNYEKARITLCKTPTGQALWNKYANSSTNDIYIAMERFIEEDYNMEAFTLSDIQDWESLIVDGKLNLSKYYTSVSSTDGVDASKSEGKNIHIVMIDLNVAANSDKYYNAETVYHEIKSHIDNKNGSRRSDHREYYGHYKERNKPPKEGSPADIIMKELEQVRSQDNQQLPQTNSICTTFEKFKKH
jgi:RHS repeat-associated protein